MRCHLRVIPIPIDRPIMAGPIFRSFPDIWDANFAALGDKLQWATGIQWVTAQLQVQPSPTFSKWSIITKQPGYKHIVKMYVCAGLICDAPLSISKAGLKLGVAPWVPVAHWNFPLF